MQIAGKSDSCSGHDLSGLTQLEPPGRVAGSINSLARSAPMSVGFRLKVTTMRDVDNLLVQYSWMAAKRS